MRQNPQQLPSPPDWRRRLVIVAIAGSSVLYCLGTAAYALKLRLVHATPALVEVGAPTRTPGSPTPVNLFPRLTRTLEPTPTDAPIIYPTAKPSTTPSPLPSQTAAPQPTANTAPTRVPTVAPSRTVTASATPKPATHTPSPSPEPATATPSPQPTHTTAPTAQPTTPAAPAQP